VVPVTYTNAKEKIYYPSSKHHQKQGKPKYYFSTQLRAHWQEADSGRVSRYTKIQRPGLLTEDSAKLITEEERQVVERRHAHICRGPGLQIDVKGNAIVIYTADQDIETLAGVVPRYLPDPTTNPQLHNLIAERDPLFADVAVSPGG